MLINQINLDKSEHIALHTQYMQGHLTQLSRSQRRKRGIINVPVQRGITRTVCGNLGDTAG